MTFSSTTEKFNIFPTSVAGPYPQLTQISFIINDIKSSSPLYSFSLTIKDPALNNLPFFSPALTDKTVNVGQTTFYGIFGSDADSWQILTFTIDSISPGVTGLVSLMSNPDEIKFTPA